MAGHNKWSKIRHKKASTDATRSKIFSQLSKLISVEVKVSGGDRNASSVRTAVEKAKKENMPKDNIEKAIQRGLEKGSESLEKVLYEAYGPGGSAILILTLTDNRNRTAAEVRHTLTKLGIALASPGSALWMFEQKEGEYTAKETLTLANEDEESLIKVVETLNEIKDVHKVTTNTTI